MRKVAANYNLGVVRPELFKRLEEGFAKRENLKKILARPRPMLTDPSIKDPGISKLQLQQRAVRAPVRIPKMEKQPISTSFPVKKVVEVFKNIVNKPEAPKLGLPKEAPLGDKILALNPGKQASVTPYKQGFMQKLSGWARGSGMINLMQDITPEQKARMVAAWNAKMHPVAPKHVVEQPTKFIPIPTFTTHPTPEGNNLFTIIEEAIRNHKKWKPAAPAQIERLNAATHSGKSMFSEMITPQRRWAAQVRAALSMPKEASVTPYQHGIMTKLAKLPPEAHHKVMDWLKRIMGIDVAQQAPGATPQGVAEVSSGYDRYAGKQ